MRVLSADVYDTLEFSALAFGGIGKCREFADDGGSRVGIPVCVYGHAIAAADPETDYNRTETPLTVALRRADIFTYTNDDAIDGISQRLNGRAAKPYVERFPFSEWCAELDVVRGE